jgi:hypothetical protein
LRLAPPDALTQRDAPYLAASHLDAHHLGGIGERIHGPVGSLCLVKSLRRQSIVAEKPSRQVFRDQGHDPGTLIFCDARLASGSGAISETIHAVGIEAV